MKRFQICSLDHMTLIVKDLEATRDFYIRLLGMFEIKRPDFDFPGAWFGITQEQTHAEIHATVASELAGMAGWGDRSVVNISRGHHLAFQVNDAIEAEAFLRAEGVEIAVSPRLRPDGPTQFYVYDPDKHVIELFSFSKVANLTCQVVL